MPDAPMMGSMLEGGPEDGFGMGWHSAIELGFVRALGMRVGRGIRPFAFEKGGEDAHE
jgi:hypothetical protein